MDSLRDSCEREALADAAEQLESANESVFPRLSTAALIQLTELRNVAGGLRSHNLPRVAAVLMSGEKVGWCIHDQAVEHRFTFRGNLMVEELLQDGLAFCKEADSEANETGQWYVPLPDFRPTAVIFANMQRATKKDELWNGPGPITLVQESTAV